MIKVVFFPPGDKEWMGGVNYYKNLLFALSTLENKVIEPIVFVGSSADKDVKKIYSQYSQVIEHPIFDRKSLYWFADKITGGCFLEGLLKKYQIDILSHIPVVKTAKWKTISWIPDFQHVHLPDMFTQKEINNRNSSFQKLAKYTDRVILSSYSALNDFKVFAPDYGYKANVLQFVSQPERVVQLDSPISMEKKYGIQGDFFFIPNQFWKHKNHFLAFEAVNHLKNKGISVTLVCSGLMADYRNTEYGTMLLKYIESNKLEENILLLGSIPYPDVFQLINESIAVINPSLFEGWSSTVEECKSVGREMILSDLGVHKEQYPGATFFIKDNYIDLATVMESFEPTIQEDANAISLDLQERTKEFAAKYQAIVLNLYGRPKTETRIRVSGLAFCLPLIFRKMGCYPLILQMKIAFPNNIS